MNTLKRLIALHKMQKPDYKVDMVKFCFHIEIPDYLVKTKGTHLYNTVKRGVNVQGNQPHNLVDDNSNDAVF